MAELKTTALGRIETKMEHLDADSIRYAVLQNAKSFKASWVGLGQALYSVWKDKLYKEWGYATFDSYTSKEIRIKKQTALKLLRSYYFLEKEEPGYLKGETGNKKDTAAIPTLEAIDALRLASKKKIIDKNDYDNMRKKVFEGGADGHEIKKDVTQLIRQREELDSDDARDRKRQALVRRYVSVLKSLREESKVSKMLPAQILNDIDRLLLKLEAASGC